MVWDFGIECCKMMVSKGLKFVVVKGFEASGVVVSYTDDVIMFVKFKFKGF